MNVIIPNLIFLIQGINKVELFPSLFAEDLRATDFPGFTEFVEETALQKVLDVYKRLDNDSGFNVKDTIIIGGDTIVTLNGKMYGQPKTPEKSFEFLNE